MRNTTPFTELYAAVPVEPGVDQDIAVIAATSTGELRRSSFDTITEDGAATSAEARAEFMVKHEEAMIQIQVDSAASYRKSREAHRQQMAQSRADFAAQMTELGHKYGNHFDMTAQPDTSEQDAIEDARANEYLAQLAERRAASERSLETAKEALIPIAAKAAATKEVATQAHRVGEKRWQLGKRAMALAFLPGAILGVTAVEGGLHSIEDTGISNVHADPSIFPGNSLGIIPGISDISGETTHYTITGGNTITISQTSTDAEGAAVVNPVSPDFELTGTEVAIDKKALTPVLKFIKDNDDTITAVKVIGSASDETFGPDGGLGVTDPQSQSLANKRAGAGKTAFDETAAELGVAVTGTSELSGSEAVLRTDQIATIDKIAARNGLTREQLLKVHGSAALFNSTDEQTLKDLLDNKRGVTYQITAQRHTENVQKSPLVTLKESRLFGIPGEIYASLLAAQLGNVSLMVFGDRWVGMLARSKAKRMVRQARRSQRSDGDEPQDEQ